MQAEATVVVRAHGCGTGRWWSWWVAALAVVAVAGSWLAAGGQPAPRVISGATVPAGRAVGLGELSRLSVQAQSLVSSTLGARDARFAPRHRAGGFSLAGGGVAAALSRDGVSVGGGGERLSLALAGVGRGARLSPPAAAAPRVRANRVVYLRGGGVREWYQAGPLGVEQGFALARRPAGRSGPVSLALSITGARARLRGSGVEFLGHSRRVALRYGGLAAVDARGRRLPARLSLSGSHLLLHVADRGARYPLRIDPLVQQAELMPADAVTFGWSVAADANTIVVGAPLTMVGSNHGQGAVYVFVRSGGAWKEQQELTASDGAEGDQLGISVALSGDTVVAGAWGVGSGENSYQGAAYVFVRSGTTWVEQAELTASDLGGGAEFGYSVAVAGDTAVVGSPNVPDSHGLGAAYVFVRNGGVWQKNAELTVPQPDTLCQQFCFFGWSVAILGANEPQSIVVGAPLARDHAGAAFFFFGSGHRWSRPQELVADDGVAGDQLGYSVAIGLVPGSASQEVQAGAPFATVNHQAGKGAVYAFRGMPGGGWMQVKRTSYYGVAGENFGASTAISGDTTVIGAPSAVPCQFNNCSSRLQGPPLQGAAYVSPGGAQEQKLTANDGVVDDRFGSAVAASGDIVVVGAPNALQTSTRAGVAYVFGPATVGGALRTHVRIEVTGRAQGCTTSTTRLRVRLRLSPSANARGTAANAGPQVNVRTVVMLNGHRLAASDRRTFTIRIARRRLRIGRNTLLVTATTHAAGVRPTRARKRIIVARCSSTARFTG